MFLKTSLVSGGEGKGRRRKVSHKGGAKHFAQDADELAESLAASRLNEEERSSDSDSESESGSGSSEEEGEEEVCSTFNSVNGIISKC